ncbi:hypothetical protein PYW08_004771 [Mythimna loreyi]|uniref:Uncharacterized protein n=1 Tax=Mythimna loreyi TaxID=667449 RepID=A0ACC2QDP5_9NEOP|nr:hypothetical protein PYW08_004771 [Mythimna loreyi]
MLVIVVGVRRQGWHSGGGSRAGGRRPVSVSQVARQATPPRSRSRWRSSGRLLPLLKPLLLRECHLDVEIERDTTTTRRYGLVSIIVYLCTTNKKFFFLSFFYFRYKNQI